MVHAVFLGGWEFFLSKRKKKEKWTCVELPTPPLSIHHSFIPQHFWTTRKKQHTPCCGGGGAGSAWGGTDELNQRLPKLHGSTEKSGDVTDAPTFPTLEEKLQCKQWLAQDHTDGRGAMWFNEIQHHTYSSYLAASTARNHTVTDGRPHALCGETNSFYTPRQLRRSPLWGLPGQHRETNSPLKIGVKVLASHPNLQLQTPSRYAPSEQGVDGWSKKEAKN